jgi:hypothetical protein
MTYISAQRRDRDERAFLAAQLRRVADDRQVVLVRGRRSAVDGPWIVHAYGPTFDRMLLAATAVAELGRLLEAARPDLSWIRGHDYELNTGMWRASPRPEEYGAVPADDRTFGGSAPVFLPYAVTPTVTAPKDIAA